MKLKGPFGFHPGPKKQKIRSAHVYAQICLGVHKKILGVHRIHSTAFARPCKHGYGRTYITWVGMTTMGAVSLCKLPTVTSLPS